MSKEKQIGFKLKTVGAVLPFTRTNYTILISGLVCIILGYIALSQKPWDGFFPLVVAPILLVLGYCVVIPIGIMYRKKEKKLSTEN